VWAVPTDTLLTEREVASYLARQNASTKDISAYFGPRVRQDPRNRDRLRELLMYLAVPINDPRRGILYALKTKK
jgi:hypothetical protein